MRNSVLTTDRQTETKVHLLSCASQLKIHQDSKWGNSWAIYYFIFYPTQISDPKVQFFFNEGFSYFFLYRVFFIVTLYIYIGYWARNNDLKKRMKTHLSRRGPEYQYELCFFQKYFKIFSCFLAPTRSSGSSSVCLSVCPWLLRILH